MILFPGCSHDQDANDVSPYAGQESLKIKGLNSQEIEGYLNGMGMGLSKVAELNQYPGPKHVLELADQLELTLEQKEQTQHVFELMKQNAIENGKEYIAKEKELNLLFELGHITPASADSLLMEIGEIKAKLRAVHVQAHIKMKEILTSEQISKYDQLRGYTNGSPDHVHL